jgi:colanic acid biosynthesis glycosyl transferase WcaI
MKVLFLNQFFWPDSSATSQLLTDLTRHLVERGHEVSVICADGVYASGERGNPPRVHIERVKSLPFVRGKIGRILSYLSFYVLAFFRALSLPKPDVVVSLTTPPLISLVGTLVKALRGSRHFIWEMDIYPDVAIDLNYIQAGGMADRITGSISDFSRHHADGILSLGECMRERLIRRGIAPSKILVTQNWADASEIEPVPYGTGSEHLVLLYSGNLGLAHDLGTIQDAIGELRHEDQFRFVFVGGGARRKELSSFVEREKITSVELRDYAPRASLGESLSLGDIGLVTQQNACCGSVVPSKVYGILAAGRPVLFIGPAEATPALIIDRFECGWQVDCGDAAGLARLLRELAAKPGEVQAAGQRARKALLAHFDLSIGVQRIARILEYSPTDVIAHHRVEPVSEASGAEQRRAA